MGLLVPFDVIATRLLRNYLFLAWRMMPSISLVAFQKQFGVISPFRPHQDRWFLFVVARDQ